MLHLVFAILTLFMISSYSSISYTSPLVTYATSTTSTSNSIPSAEDVHSSESIKVPPSVGTFVILIPNEAHENWSDEKHKLITDKNSYYIPTSLFVPNVTALVFLHADAPWDT